MSTRSPCLEVFCENGVTNDITFHPLRAGVNVLVDKIMNVLNANIKDSWKLRGYKVIRGKVGGKSLIDKCMLVDLALLIEKKSEKKKEGIAVSNSQVEYGGFRYNTKDDLLPAKIDREKVACWVYNLVGALRKRLKCQNSPVKMTLLKTKKFLTEENWEPCRMHVDFAIKRCGAIEKKVRRGKGSLVGPVLLIAPIKAPVVLDVAGRLRNVKEFAFQIERVKVEVGEVLMLAYDCVHRTGAPILPESVYENGDKKDWLSDEAPRLHILFESEMTLYKTKDGGMEEINQQLVMDLWDGAHKRTDFYNKWFYCYEDDSGKVKLRDGMSEDPGDEYHKRTWNSLSHKYI